MLATLWRDVRIFAAGLRRPAGPSKLESILRQREEFEKLTGEELRAIRPASRSEVFAKAAVASERILALRPHQVQILGALAMAEGKIAEMQTGEGKTLAAVMAVYAYSLSGGPVHVLTANDYLARRDAEWMGEIYRFLGLTAGFIAQSMPPEERRRAYACDVTYATPNELGFDFLRDQLALRPGHLVLPEFKTALLDEADSILIDEARIPLVIAGGKADAVSFARRMALIAETLIAGRDYLTDDFRRNARLTDAGVSLAESTIPCDNLYAVEN